MIIPKTQIAPNEYGPDYSALTEEQRGNVARTALTTVDGVEVYEVTFTDKYQKALDKAEMEHLKAELAEPAEKAFVLERKIARFVETDDKNVLVEPEPEIPYENGIEVFRGQVISEGGEKWIVNLNSFVTQEDWRPSVLYTQGNRTLWRKKQPDIPDGDLCAETPAWDGGKWHDYIVGYKVKHDSAIWEAINTTHTWIAPAHDGDGAISWKHTKDCT